MSGILIQVPRRHPLRDDEQHRENIRCHDRAPVHLCETLDAAAGRAEARVHDLAQAPDILTDVLPPLRETDRCKPVLIVELEYPDIGETRVGLDFPDIDEAAIILHPQPRVEFPGHDGTGHRKLELFCRTLRNRGDQFTEDERGNREDDADAKQGACRAPGRQSRAAHHRIFGIGGEM